MGTIRRVAVLSFFATLLSQPLAAQVAPQGETGAAPAGPAGGQVPSTGQIEQPARGQAGDASAPGQSAAGQHLLVDTMRGRVVAIDHQAGTVSVRTEDGTTVNLTFAPEVVRNVRQGDDISARLDVVHTGASREQRAARQAEAAADTGAAPAAAGQSPSVEIGRQYVTGTVTAVNPARGSLQLTSERGPLTLIFPPSSLQNIQKGEQLTVELGFARSAAPAGAQHAAGRSAGDPTEEYEQASEAGPQAGQPPRSQTFRATVTSVDRTHGIVALQPVGDLQPMLLQFTPTAVEDLKTGEDIIARLTYTFGAPTMPERGIAGDAPLRVPEGEPITGEELAAELGLRQVSGTIANLDHQTGRLDLSTDQATLRLQFAPQAVARLANGQQITVDMGFSRASETKD